MNFGRQQPVGNPLEHPAVAAALFEMKQTSEMFSKCVPRTRGPRHARPTDARPPEE